MGGRVQRWAAVLVLAATVSGGIPAGVAAEVAPWAAELEAEVAAGRLDRAVLAALQRDGGVAAILTFRPAAGDDAYRPAIIARRKADALEPLRGVGGIVRDYARLYATFVQLTSAEQLLSVLQEPAVGGLRVNRGVRPADSEANRLIRQPQARAAGFRGAGTAVAVLDTGVNYRGQAFGSCTAPGRPAGCRVVAARDFAPRDGQLDADGHGTAVAEVVASVAPGAKLLALDVFRANGLAYDSDLLAAIDWTIRHRDTWNVRAINLSIADSTHWLVACPLSGLAPAFAAAKAARMVVAVASGNGAALAGQYIDGIAYPACVPGALSVGGVYDADVGPAAYADCSDSSTGRDRIACFSQGGAPLGMLGPAASISADGMEWRGTSFAAAHVAAAAAILAAAAPRATADRIAYVLRTSGPAVRDPRNGIRRDRLDVYAGARLIRDSQRPTIVSRSPAPNAEGVALSTIVTAIFSERVSGVNAGSMTLRLAGGVEVPALVAYDAAHRRATLRPTLLLLPGTTYTVSLGSGILDAAGNHLRSVAWSFTTVS
jgi:subtilisin family serine protease